MQFSPEQQQAIYTCGSSLLVSAAAGSGKTAVLVQRVIEKILSGADITGLWIMTFTNAAASEMRLKIENAVAEQLESDPQNEHLQRQSLLLPSANISTVHSLCKRIIDMNFQQLGLEAGVAIGDESVLDIVFERTLEDFVEEIYRQAADDEDIARMISFFSGGRSDAKLLNVLHLAYRDYVERPYPKTEFVASDDLFDNFEGDELYTSVLDKLSEAATQYDALEDRELQPLAETALFSSMATEQEGVRLALAKWKERDFDAAGAALVELRFTPWNTRGKAFAEYLDKLDAVKRARSYAKDIISSLCTQVFNRSAQQHLADIRQTCRILTTLYTLIRQLDERFWKAKREKGVISFADMERLALKLLVAEYDARTDTLVPTDIALQLRDQIDEIIVDEYQDTNRKQDLIFRALSRDGENIFMVGDVKQSIYRFRSAAPELFMQKRQSAFALEGGYDIDRPSYLYLNRNFRSHPAILSFANQIFQSAMSKGLGEIDYDTSEMLYHGGLYPEESEGRVELDIVLSDTDGNDEFELTALEQEAALVAQKIQKLYGTPFYDVKQKKMRPLEYGDMAILCRVTGGVTGQFETALRRLDVDCINNNQDQQFLDVWEVGMLRAFLQVISNPYRDVPLITLMYSDFYAFSAAELARIRALDKRGYFYDAVRLAAQNDAKCAAFLSQVESLRAASVGKRTDEVISMIFAATHILEKVAAYPDGKTRVANMRLMLHYAVEFEKDSYKGLFAYLNYLDKMAQLQKILPGATGSKAPENCVHLLSIHKSKGLEYPVCFIVNLSKGFRDRENDTLIHHPTLGCALTMRDDEKFREYTSLSYALIHESARREALSEEMRILYVALTRPKTHLYLVASGEREKLKELLSSVVSYEGSRPAEFLSKAPSALRWLLFALRGQKGLEPLYRALEVPCESLSEDCCFESCVYDHITAATARKVSGKEEEQYAPALELILAQYPHQYRTTLPLKLSVSEVKGMRQEDPEALPLIAYRSLRRTPNFLDGKVAGNAVGNAVHKFMQFSDFAALGRVGGFEKERERLLAQAFLTEKEMSLVPPEMIEKFLAQPLFKDMTTADTLEKEKRFLFTMPADKLFADCKESEPILLQGVLDCYYEKNGKLIIVDYKTDRLKSEQQFVQRYATQLQLYRVALHRILGKKADKLYVYSFYLDQVIEIS